MAPKTSSRGKKLNRSKKLEPTKPLALQASPGIGGIKQGTTK
ncbi:MAG TPA: hypothetical protein VJR23_07385 [Candidatus Acidoferrales bacterium]|nr:hypothetical protein [Candidatus Acidoferrales bacterium]